MNLERWLRATSNPETQLSLLLEEPLAAGRLATLLGVSQPLADILIQNPELAHLATEPAECHLPTREAVEAEGRRMLVSATSPSHGRDRLRYLKQRWTLPIAIQDLNGLSEPEMIWRALSELADALITLSVESTWAEHAREKGLSQECPVSVVGFGKLGGSELNYSSDIDLVFVLQDEADAATEKLATRFSEGLIRSLGEKMGRGSLYRVDLRLRPYGASGSLVPTMRAVEAYYRSYAEFWEVQALIRSRVIVGAALDERWEALVERRCFSSALSELALADLVENRVRIEDLSDKDDLKRGHGGIRDVEFATQIVQLSEGARSPEARVKNTLDAIDALRSLDRLSMEDAETLKAGYRLLRTLEHRCQLIGDQQTHAIPQDPARREEIARTTGFTGWEQLEAALGEVRQAVREVYERVVGDDGLLPDSRARVRRRAGQVADALCAWFDHLPEASSFYDVLCENQDSLHRAKRLLVGAPRVVEQVRESVALTEGIVSGEVEEWDGFGSRLGEVAPSCTSAELAAALSHDWTIAAVRWALSETPDLGESLAEIADKAFCLLRRKVGGSFDILALGSYGERETSFSSDFDVVLLTAGEQASTEKEVQQWISELEQIRRFGSPISVDLRLRPEGGKGLLVRSYGGFANYELEDMEMWERFALGHARLVAGEPEARDVVIKAAYAVPLTPERLRELVAMKRRIEMERVAPQHLRRDVKLGEGSLSDLEWFVHLHEMRFPTATQAGTLTGFDARLRRLLECGLINSVEHDVLGAARKHLLRVRARLWLLGFEGDVIPENPAKLDRLAGALGFLDGNSFLLEHEELRSAVRQIYQEGLERLRA